MSENHLDVVRHISNVSDFGDADASFHRRKSSGSIATANPANLDLKAFNQATDTPKPISFASLQKAPSGISPKTKKPFKISLAIGADTESTTSAPFSETSSAAARNQDDLVLSTTTPMVGNTRSLGVQLAQSRSAPEFRQQNPDTAEFIQNSLVPKSMIVERVGVMAAYESLEDLQNDFEWLVSQFAGRCATQSDLIHVLHVAMRFRSEVVNVEDDDELVKLLSPFLRQNRDQLYASQV